MRDVLAAFGRVHPAGKGYAAACPAHEDARNSLSIGRGDNGCWLLRCHAGCSLDQILAAAHLERADLRPTPAPATGGGRIVATYDYLDAARVLVYQVTRRRFGLDDRTAPAAGSGI